MKSDAAPGVVADLCQDLDDSDLVILTRLFGRFAAPSEPDEEDRWPSRVIGFWHGMAAALDEEQCRRVRMVRELSDLTSDDGPNIGCLVEDEDMSGWIADRHDSPPDAA